jgi:hypothetical protein
MKKINVLILFLSLIVILACGEQKQKTIAKQSKKTETNKIIKKDTTGQKEPENITVKKEIKNTGMSPEESEILDMMVS